MGGVIDKFNIKSKICVITGISGGIGKEIALKFLEQGAIVTGISTQKNFQCEGVDHYVCDVTKLQECTDFYNQVIDKYGKIDILVNCAGITRDALTKNMTEEQFDDVINVNLKGVWNITKLVGPHMQNNKSGSIINISSVVGIYGNIGQANYSATKAGIIGMTKSWAKEFAYKNSNVRVNAVEPGYTMTNMISTVPTKLLDEFATKTMLGRLARPDEIANVVLFLASDMSSYITGAVIPVDGGMRL